MTVQLPHEKTKIINGGLKKGMLKKWFFFSGCYVNTVDWLFNFHENAKCFYILWTHKQIYWTALRIYSIFVLSIRSWLFMWALATITFACEWICNTPQGKGIWPFNAFRNLLWVYTWFNGSMGIWYFVIKWMVELDNNLRCQIWNWNQLYIVDWLCRIGCVLKVYTLLVLVWTRTNTSFGFKCLCWCTFQLGKQTGRT